jgi:hypothetical protein
LSDTWEKREYGLIPIVKPGYANICLTRPFSEWPETRRYLIAIAFHLCFRKGHQEGSSKPGWIKVEWGTCWGAR